LADEAAESSAPAPVNFESPTLGGTQLWNDELVFHDWRIQRNVVSSHYRLLDDKNVRRAWGTFAQCREELEKLRREKTLPPLKPRVVLVLHGLVRTRESMGGMRDHLRGANEFNVLNVTYASTRGKLSEHAAALAQVMRHLEGVEEVHFVCHSLGNLVVRHYLGDRERKPDEFAAQPRVGRIVMLAPPNHGAELARHVRNNLMFRAVWGASGGELAANWPALEKRLATPLGEFGIIAGGYENDKGRNPLLAGDDDFVVTVEETRLPGAADFLVLPVFHGRIMDDAKVQECTLRFLRHGHFQSAEQRQPIAR